MSDEGSDEGQLSQLDPEMMQAIAGMVRRLDRLCLYGDALARAAEICAKTGTWGNRLALLQAVAAWQGVVLDGRLRR